MTQPIRKLSGISAQQRIANRRQQLLDTAYHAMISGQWENLSISALCENSALNKRYFYESFTDLDAVAVAIFDDLSQALQQVALSAIHHAQQQQFTPNAFATYILSAVVDFLSDDPARLKILFTDQLTGLALVKSRLLVKDQIIDLLVHYAKQHYQADDQFDDTLINMTAALLIGGTVEILQQWISAKILISKQQLILDLTLLWQKLGDMTAEIVNQRL